MIPDDGPAMLSDEDQAAIEERVGYRADELLDALYERRPSAEETLEYVADPLGMLAELAFLIGEATRGCACLTAQEQLGRLAYRADRLLRPLCEARAEDERDEIAYRYFESQREPLQEDAA